MKENNTKKAALTKQTKKKIADKNMSNSISKSISKIQKKVDVILDDQYIGAISIKSLVDNLFTELNNLSSARQTLQNRLGELDGFFYNTFEDDSESDKDISTVILGLSYMLDTLRKEIEQYEEINTRVTNIIG